MTELPNLFDRFWFHFGPTLILVGTVFVFWMLSLVSRKSEPAADRLRTLLGLEAMNGGLFFLALCLWVALFALLTGGLASMIWKVVWHSLPTRENVWEWRFLLAQLVALTGVLGAVVALPFTLTRLRLTREQNRTAEESLFNDKINAASADLYAMRQISRKVTDPQAGLILRDMWEDDVVRRNAAIDRLEGLVRERPEMAGRVSRMLGVYVREVSAEIFPEAAKDGEAVQAARSDLEKAAQTLGRLRVIKGVVGEDVEQDLLGAWLSKGDFDGLDFKGARLNDANLQGARLDDANLQGAWLGGANLQEAWLEGANLRGAGLGGANLHEAWLEGANLQEAWLPGANLQEAWLRGANLQGAGLGGANLQEARLMRANLQGAWLIRANLQGAGLGGANLQEAWLEGAKLKFTDLSGCRLAATPLRSVHFSEPVGLTQSQVNESYGVRNGFGQVKLPAGIAAPAHWHVAEAAQQDSRELSNAFGDAYKQWMEEQREDAED